MKSKKYIIALLFILSIMQAKAQSRARADSLFYAANNRLRAKWDFIDTATFSKSIRDYSKVLELYPEYWQASRNRARIYMHQKKYEFALEDLTNAIQYANKITFPKIFEMRGQVFYSLKMYKEAVDDFDVALKDPQDKAKTLLLSAKAKWKLGNKKGACKDYNDALLLDATLEKQKEFIRCEQK